LDIYLKIGYIGRLKFRLLLFTACTCVYSG